MGWKVYGDIYDTSGSLTDQSKFNPVIFTNNVILIGCRTWFLSIDNPTFTDLSMEIYSNDPSGGNPGIGTLVATSTNVRTKAQMISDNTSIIETFFNFDNFNCKSGETYNFSLTGTGYSPTATSFLCWRMAWPDPVYTINYTPNSVNVPTAPYFLSTFITGKI